MIRKIVKSLVHASFHKRVDLLITDLRYFFLRLANHGTRFFCPVCLSRLDSFALSEPDGRRNLICGVCGSFERHRLDALLLKKRGLLSTGRLSMLHLAPERCIDRLFSGFPGLTRVTADLSSTISQTRMDLTGLAVRDSSFDAFYCNHVLEHIPDDTAAISEIFRILKPGGWGLIQVPVRGEKTFEDFSLSTPEERTRVFGQHDHVRNCGDDYVDRFRRAGFTTEVLLESEIVRDRFLRRRYGIEGRRPVYLIRKPALPL